jgi:hypothetical protein
LAKIAFAKGTIFYRWQPESEGFSDRLKQIVSPIGLSPDHLKSWWILPQSVKALRDQFPDVKISVVPRRYWMTGLPSAELEPRLEDWNTFILNLEERLSNLSARQECLLVGLHAKHSPFDLGALGFIAAPHFISAMSKIK